MKNNYDNFSFSFLPRRERKKSMKKTISLLCALFMAFSSVSVPIKAEEEIETE